MREKLSALAHKMWAGWMMWMFTKGDFNKDDGTWTMPKEFVDRWTRQVNTTYEDLPENEKESDRKEADRMIEIFENKGE